MQNTHKWGFPYKRSLPNLLTILKYFTDPLRDLKDLLHDYNEWRMVQNPEYGSEQGRHEFDHLITEYTEEAFQATKVRYIYMKLYYSSHVGGMAYSTLLHSSDELRQILTSWDTPE